ncbi:MAG TPA: carotenoid oxygenase family protein, partial [Acidimicrobiales bacterium]|nr:carotenoid oxygenase family protein [Acidimicrobiales bacterium]
DMFGPPFLRYHVADAAGSLVRTEAITVPGSTMVHDFAITRSRVMFMDLPVVFDMDLVGKRGMPYRWDADYGARVGVMPRDGGDADIIWCEIEPCYVFHVLNAYDDGDEIVADVCRYDHMFAGDVHGIAGADPRLVRWHIDPAARKVREEEVLGLPSEFPRVDDRLAGSRHRYGYMTSINAATDVALHGLRKVDLLTGATTEHDFGSGRSSGEGVFVPAGDGSGEDEGFVLSVVHDAATDGSELVILDASDFSAPPVATVRLPQRVPFGFHGNWVPSGSVTA